MICGLPPDSRAITQAPNAPPGVAVEVAEVTEPAADPAVTCGDPLPHREPEALAAAARLQARLVRALVSPGVTIVSGGRQVSARIVGEVFSTQNDGLQLITDWRTLQAVAPAATPVQYDVGLRPGTDEAAYVQGLGSRLGSAYFVFPNQRHSVVVQLMVFLIGTLTLLLAIVAGLGVLNTVVLYIRERVHDIGVFRAVGMTPRQTIAMVVCWVAGAAWWRA
jgi:putative ABC transport system permease protein